MNQPVGAPNGRVIVAFLGLALSRPPFRHTFDEPDDGLARRSWQADTRFPSVEIVNARAREVQEGNDRLPRSRPLLRENGGDAFVEGPQTPERITTDGHAPINPGDDPPIVVQRWAMFGLSHGFHSVSKSYLMDGFVIRLIVDFRMPIEAALVRGLRLFHDQGVRLGPRIFPNPG